MPDDNQYSSEEELLERANKRLKEIQSGEAKTIPWEYVKVTDYVKRYSVTKDDSK